MYIFLIKTISVTVSKQYLKLADSPHMMIITEYLSVYEKKYIKSLEIDIAIVNKYTFSGGSENNKAKSI